MIRSLLLVLSITLFYSNIFICDLVYPNAWEVYGNQITLRGELQANQWTLLRSVIYDGMYCISFFSMVLKANKYTLPLTSFLVVIYALSIIDKTLNNIYSYDLSDIYTLGVATGLAAWIYLKKEVKTP